MFNNQIKVLNLSNNVQYINLIKYIDDNSNKIKIKYLDIINRLDREKFKNQTLRDHFSFKKDYNLWEMSSVIEKSTLKENGIKNLLKYIALQEISNNKEVKEITLFNFEKKFKKIFNNKKIVILENFDFKKKISNYFSKLSILIIIKYLIFLFRNFSFLRKKYLFQKNSILFLSYYAHLDSSEKHTAWGNLYQKYSSNNNFLYFFLPSKKNFFFKNKNHLFINNFFYLKDFFYVIKKFNFYRKKFQQLENEIFYKKKTDELNEVLFILKDDIQHSLRGFLLLQNLTWIVLFDRMLKEIPFQKKGIYIYENQPWERAFISAWKKFNHGKLYGFVTATIHFWLLNYTDTNHELASRPNYVICSSNFTKQFLKENFYHEKYIFVTETLRYNNLYTKQIIKSKDEKKNLVFFGDYFRPINNNLINIMNYISTCEEIKKKYKIYFKPHPENNLWKIEKNIEILKDKKKLEYSIVISPNTSIIGVEFIDSKIKTFIYKDENFIDLSPLKNLPSIPDKIVFKNSTQLKLLLKNVENKYYENFKLNYFHQGKSLKKWESLIKKND